MADGTPRGYDVLCTDADPQWKALRWEGLTASVLPGLLGLIPWETRTQERLLDAYARREDIDQSPMMWLGTITEAGALERAASQERWTSYRASHELVCRPGDEWLKATLDAVASVDGEDVIAEVKLHRFATKDRSLPDYIAAQCQLQMWITGIHCTHVVRTYVGQWPEVTRLDFNSATAEALVAEARALWAKVKALREEIER